MCKVHYTLKHGEEAFWKEEFNCSFRSLHLFTKWLSIKESNFTKYNKHQMHISTTLYRLYTQKKYPYLEVHFKKLACHIQSPNPLRAFTLHHKIFHEWNSSETNRIFFYIVFLTSIEIQCNTGSLQLNHYFLIKISWNKLQWRYSRSKKRTAQQDKEMKVGLN